METRSRWSHVYALGLYLGASLAMFGWPLLGHMRDAYLGIDGSDPKLSMWCLSWWPHAVAHGLDPFVSKQFWAPTGFNLAWVTGIPGLSAVAGPITATAGPVAAYNVLAILAAPLAAWTAYLLCRRLTGAFWPSTVGGFIFGFSTYETGQLMNHMNLFFVCLPPLAVLLAVGHAQGSMSSRRFVVLLALVLVGQFLVSTEILATMTLLGAIALGTAIAGDRSRRGELWKTAGLAGISYALAAVLASPFLAFVIRGPVPVKPFRPVFGSADLLNIVVPTRITSLGHGTASHVASSFTGYLSENGAYFGIPLLLILVLFAITRRRTLAGLLVPVVFLASAVLALGPRLKVHGRPTVTMPWELLRTLPLIGRALPVRLVMYGFLAAGVAVALWLASGRWGILRWTLALLAVASLLPNLGVAPSHTRVNIPSVFPTGLFRRLLSPDEIVLPVGPGRGWPMLWQARAGMAFRMPTGSLGSRPPGYSYGGLAAELIGAATPPAVPESELRAFLTAHRVDAILLEVGPWTPRWRLFLSGLGVRPRTEGGVLVYRLGLTRFASE